MPSRRDSFFACIIRYGDVLGAPKCATLRSEYEGACPAAWVSYFNRRRAYEMYKQQLIEDGYRPSSKA